MRRAHLKSKCTDLRARTFAEDIYRLGGLRQHIFLNRLPCLWEFCWHRHSYSLLHKQSKPCACSTRSISGQANSSKQAIDRLLHFTPLSLPMIGTLQSADSLLLSKWRSEFGVQGHRCSALAIWMPFEVVWSSYASNSPFQEVTGNRFGWFQLMRYIEEERHVGLQLRGKRQWAKELYNEREWMERFTNLQSASHNIYLSERAFLEIAALPYFVT